MSSLSNTIAHLLVGATTRINAFRAGLTRKSVSVNGYTIHYYEGGRGETLVLLHGLAHNKTSFVASAAGLTRKYRVILPDLVGHGENARDPGQDYSIRGHVESMKAFFDA